MERAGIGIWLDTARCLPTSNATPAQARQSILLTRCHEHLAREVTAQGQHIGKDLGCAAVNSGMICHWHMGQQGVASSRGTHEAGAPTSPTESVQPAVPGEGTFAGSTLCRSVEGGMCVEGWVSVCGIWD